MALMDLGTCYLKQGELTKAGEHLEQSLVIFQRIGTEVYLPELLRLQAELQVHSGHPDHALPLALQAVDWATRLERRLELGQAHCILGQVHRALGHPHEAEAAFVKA